MQINSIIRPVFLASVILTAVGCNSSDSGPIATPSFGGQTATGNGGSTTVGGNSSTQSSNGGNVSSNATGGATNSTSNGGSNNGQGGSNADTGGSNNSNVGGSSTPSAGGSTTAATGGNKATGGATTTTAGGTTAGGSTATGGKATGGALSTTAGGSTATGGKATGGASSTTTGGTTTSTGGATATATGGATGTSVSESSACPKITWPTATGGTVTISGTKSVTNYDGGGALHEGNLNDCSIGDQDSTKAIIEVADGGSVKNVIFGKNIGDGIHCLGSCTIDNVWFNYVCDDAITINRDGSSTGTSTISNAGFKGARDKTIQHNGGNSTVNISNVYVEVAGKLYRSCGSGGGCTSGAKHTVNISNVVAIGVNQIAGVSESDKVTLKNICTFRSPVLCNTYKANSDTDSTTGANGTGEGPSPSCSYTAADTHALVSKVGGVTLTTDVLCPGSNSAKTGSTATTCISGFETCLKVCAPGMYGFKQLTCSASKYTAPDSGGCALVTAATDSAAAAGLASSKASTATGTATKNSTCTTQWAWGKDSSNSANYCACVEKPGYYQASSGSAQPNSWMVWDCQSQWW